MSSSADSQVLAGRYRVVERLGSGGMATVFLAEDERLGRPVAVKRLHADTSEDMALRFEREAKLGASLNHPNVVAIYDIATEAEGFLIVMEYVKGETLRDELHRGWLAPERGMEVLRAVAAALDHAHGHGVIHRDVKPANVLLGRAGVVKLADLGVATAVDRTQITRSGTALGTPSYMAPEQLEGSDLTSAVDIYALAAVAFEAFAGRKARTGRTPMEIVHAVANKPVPDIREAWPDAPPALAEALKRGMDAEPDRRPPSAGELAREIEAALAGPLENDADTAELPPEAARRPVAAAAAPAAAAAAPRGRPAPAPPVRPRTGSAAGRRLAGLVPIALVALLLGVGAIVLLSGGGDEDGSSRSGERASGDERQTTRDERPSSRDDGTTGSQEPAPAGTPAPQDESPSTSRGAPAAAKDPAEGARLNDRGFSLIGQGRAGDAVPILQRSVASFPEDSTSMPYAFALFNLGNALRLSGRPAEAIPFLEKRLAISDFKRDVVQRELALARQQAGGNGASAPNGAAPGSDGRGRGKPPKSKSKSRDDE